MSTKLRLKLQVINNSCVPLRRATDGSAGIDLPRGLGVGYIGGITTYDTGIAVAIPPGYCGLVIARSSLYNKGWRLANGVGVIDSDYRGNIKLVLTEVRQEADCLFVEDYVAQLVIVPVPTIEIEQVTSLPDTVRGAGGFGSTDVNKGEPQSPLGSTNVNKGGVEL